MSATRLNSGTQDASAFSAVARFRSIFGDAADFISILDREGRVVFESDSIFEASGHEPGASLGMIALEFVHPDDQPAMAAAFARLVSQPGGEDRARYRYRCATGSYLRVESTARNLLDDPLVAGIFVRSRDVTAEIDADVRYERLFGANPIPTLVIDPSDAHVVAANDAALLAYGYPREEMLARKLADLGDLSVEGEASGLTIAPGIRAHRRQDGSSFEADCVVASIRFHGRPAFIVCVRDVSGSASAARELAMRDRYLSASVEIQRELLASPSVDAAMPRVLELLGEASGADRVLFFEYPPLAPTDPEWGTLIHQWCAEGVEPTRPPTDGRGTESLLELARARWLPGLAAGNLVSIDRAELERGAAELLERRGINLVLLAPVLVQGELRGMVSFQDSGNRADWSIGDRTHLQSIASIVGLALSHELTTRALAMDNEWLDFLLSGITDGIVATDVEGRITLVNPHAEKLFGVPGAEMLGRPLTDHFAIDLTPGPVSELERPPDFDAVRHVLETGETVEGAHFVNLVRPDGRRMPIAGSTAPLRDADGNVAGVIRVFRDATRDAAVASELMKASKLESVGLLAGGIAHDFNNILTAVIGNLALAVDRSGDNPDVSGPILESMRAAWRARDLTNQLLTFSTGGKPVKCLVSVDDLIREGVTFALRGSSVSGRFVIASNLPLVEADPGQLGQVVHNIALNAVQAMPQGGNLVVSAECRPQGRGAVVSIELRDDGPGIVPENLGRIFDPFFTTKSHGTGLGLSASYSIIRAHGGLITCESKAGEGACFRIELPVATDQTAPMAPSVQQTLLIEQQQGGRILLMDDEEPIRTVAGRLLVRLGYEFVAVREGDEAVEAFQRARAEGRPFVTAILDLTVPGGVGGERAMRVIREIDPSFRAIVSSGYADEPALAEPERYGFCATLRKPYRFEDLADVLRRTIHGGTPAAAA